MKRKRKFREPRAEIRTEDLRPPDKESIDRPQALEVVSVTKLKPYPRNARMHSNKQIRQLAASMRRFGVTAPILIDENNTVLAGHGRLLAAKHLELKFFPVDG